MEIQQILGFAGTALVLIAYVPQIQHLLAEKCSAGVSRKAFIIWFISSLCLLVNAFFIMDYVFISLQVINLVATATIIYCAAKYKDSVCEYHRNKLSSSKI